MVLLIEGNNHSCESDGRDFSPIVGTPINPLGPGHTTVTFIISDC